MSSGTSSEINGRWGVPGSFYAFSWSGLRLITIASALHVFLAIALFAAGRAQIAPTLIDRDGMMDSFAHDSYDYQRGAVQLAELLRSGELANWVSAAQPVHVKILAVPFALLGPIFGYGVLSAEPYNVLCYATIVGLVFALGREASNRRAGVLAAGSVALCPTFLLHTTQLLKDSLFIAGLLVFLFSATTSLTRTYSPKLASGIAVLTTFMLFLLFFVRQNVVIATLGVSLLSLALLVVRQYLQRQLLPWNMMSTLAVLFTALLLTSFSTAHTTQKLKQFPSDQSGQPKIAAGTDDEVPTGIVRIASRTTLWNSHSIVGRWGAVSDKLARRISSMRSRFAASYPDSGSQLDSMKEFRSLNDLFGYLPRALEIGLWAPFPNTWVVVGRRIGSAGRLLAAGETFLIYLCQLLAVLAIVREPRRLSLWFLFAIAVLGVTTLALIVPNVGALYRFRYTFWILEVIVAMAGLDKLITSIAVHLRSRGRPGRLIAQTP